MSLYRKPLLAFSASLLLEEKQTRIGIRRGNLLRNYAFQFIQLCAPELTEDVVTARLALP